MYKLKVLIPMIILCFVAEFAYGHIDPNRKNNMPTQDTQVSLREDCQPGTRQIDQQINNVRARLNTGGDVWWDLSDGKYIVPKPAPGDLEISSIFAGGVWIGGTDPSGNLKLAGITYRNSTSNDFYTGPLDPETGGTDKPICEDWDRFFTVLGEDVNLAIDAFDAGTFTCDSVGLDMRYWPGKGNPYFLEKYEFELPNTGQGLGAFWDEDQDGIYDPCVGDFPIIDIRGCEPETREAATELVPDEMIFWIYNDAGGVHSETQGQPIKMEVQVQAFSYATNDEINDMTFQRYKLINRATTDIQDCYFAMWVDPDLGCYSDDYIGCDVERSMAIVYNEDALDGDVGITCPGGVNTYQDEVPMLGVDYFRGPLSPKLINEFGEFVTPPAGFVGEIDTFLEEGMTSFIYMNNGGVGDPPEATTDAAIAQQYYNYLLGTWRDGTALTFGGNGYNIGSTDTVKYVFPDVPNNDAGWSMCTADLPFGDRRTLQATGPLLLQPQAVNELIVGVVWVPNVDYPCPDFSKLQNADDLAQALFDNCFDITDGPDAPDMCLVELDKEIILILTNDSNRSNNKFEEYEEADLLAPPGTEDSTYVFEGYQILQLISASVTAQEYDDVEKARIVGQVDIKNDVSTLYNWSADIDPLSGNQLWSADLVVEGANTGIKNTFQITKDAFNDTKLVNHTPYYFTVLAYAYNEYEEFSSATGLGQRKPYLQGRGNISTYTAIPRPIVYENLNSEYGQGPVVTRLSGQGVGSTFLDVADRMYDAILDGTTNGEIEYKEGAGPVKVSIYNPLEAVDGEFILEIDGVYENAECGLAEGATWKMTNVATQEEVFSDATIEAANEQLISKYGFSITVSQDDVVGEKADDTNGAIGGTITYSDVSGTPWLSGIEEGLNVTLGPQLRNLYNYNKTNDGEIDVDEDPTQALNNIGGTFFNPFYLSDFRPGTNGFIDYITPGWVTDGGQGFLRSDPDYSMRFLNNVDIVMTSDKSKWSRCVVVEMATEQNITEGFESVGNARQFDLRQSPSVDKDGNDDGDDVGMGWFPGYAVDVETGKRLNIFFGENSIYNQGMIDIGVELEGGPNGADMLFNPSSEIANDQISNAGGGLSVLVSGGQHMMYVTGQEYDECASIREELSKSLFILKIKAFELITWTGIPLLAQDTELLTVGEGLIPNDVTVKLRVSSPYNVEEVIDIDKALDCNVLDELPKYRINFSNVATTEISDEQGSTVLSNVRAVPNPYFAYSAYETSQFNNTVKITNLPDRADVTIYSMDGKFIQQFRRDVQYANKPGSNPGITQGQVNPDLEWNMKNYAGIPIASGVYIIHVSAPDIGEERTIKWFGVNRKFDPTGL